MKSLKISPGHVLPYSLLGLLICNMYQREAQSMYQILSSSWVAQLRMYAR